MPFRSVRLDPESGGRINEITSGLAALLGDTLCDCLAAGIGVLLSPTSDGGAVSCTVYEGDDRDKSYQGHASEFEAYLRALQDHARARLVGD
jgi:hypothetical protein